MSWSSAQQYCKDKYTYGLATIKSIEDIKKLNRWAVGTSVAWIGLNDDPNSWRGFMTSDANSWRWSSTGETNLNGYQAWDVFEPNNRYREYCVQMESTGYWNDFDCGSLKPFICYTGKKS